MLRMVRSGHGWEYTFPQPPSISEPSKSNEQFPGRTLESRRWLVCAAWPTLVGDCRQAPMYWTIYCNSHIMLLYN